MAAGVGMQELNARQRKHVYMHSSIFDTGGPTTRSVYALGRQHEIYDGFAGKLRGPGSPRQPDVTLPSPADMQCTQNAGHNVVFPTAARSPGPRPEIAVERRTAAAQVPQTSTPRAGAEFLYHDGEAQPVVRSSAKDREAIPKEFWATSVNLQWHDARNERCRTKTNRTADPTAAAPSAQDMKLQDLSSEILGSTRLTAASTKVPQQDLMADTADPMCVDSSLQASLAERTRKANMGAKERLHGNLASSSQSMLSQPGPASHSPGPGLKETDSNVDRRRREKNFSDLFGTHMGERRDIRGNREEILASKTCTVFDTRTEIASRNKDHWKSSTGVAASASDRKEAERSSRLFGYSPPARSSEKIQADSEERACWDSREILHPSSEIARRRRMKDNRDIGEHHCLAHTALKQEQMASEQVSDRLRLSSSPRCDTARAQAARSGPRVTFSSPGCGSPQAAARFRSPRAPGSPRLESCQQEREHLSARNTKLATLQSSIFT